MVQYAATERVILQFVRWNNKRGVCKKRHARVIPKPSKQTREAFIHTKTRYILADVHTKDKRFTMHT